MAKVAISLLHAGDIAATNRAIHEYDPHYHYGICMFDYLGVLERAFYPDVEVALLGSVELTLELGVAPTEVLNSDEKVLAYFLD